MPFSLRLTHWVSPKASWASLSSQSYHRLYVRSNHASCLFLSLSGSLLDLFLSAFPHTLFFFQAEYVNAIGFALQNNVALSIEIGSSGSIQTALIQVPILVFFSAFTNHLCVFAFHTRDTSASYAVAACSLLPS